GAHRQAGMTAVGFLHSIYRQRTNGVDCQRLQVGAQGVPPWLFGSDNTPPILPYNPSARRSWFGFDARSGGHYNQSEFESVYAIVLHHHRPASGPDLYTGA